MPHAFVRPADVEALRRRLAPVFAALGRGAPAGSEAAALSRAGLAWACGAPATLLTAPTLQGVGGDLQARLSVLQAPGGRRTSTRTGEILGIPTMGELRDFVAAQKYQLAQLADVEGCPAWAAADAQGYGAWAGEMHDAKAGLLAAIGYAEESYSLVPESLMNLTPNNVATVLVVGMASPWDKLKAAAHPFGDLARRFIAAGYCPWPDMSAMPQPKAPDVDLHAYLWADTAAKNVEGAAKAIGSTGSGIAIGVGLALVFFVAVKIVK